MGEQRFAGAVQLGLGPNEQRSEISCALAKSALVGTESAIRQPGISLVVSGHGAADRPLRDAVIHQVVVDPADPNPA